ncbi:MAG: helix-turn-helix domain-containing protein [Planctomycetota bacterium]|nr:helix-turn-helix domain-containing protein [Planctomycetota bacterium]
MHRPPILPLNEAEFIPVELDPFLRMTAPRDRTLGVGPTAWTHYHDCMELGLCLSGSGIATINQRAFAYGPGDVMLVWPCQVHMGWTREGHAKWKFLNFDAKAVDWARPGEKARWPTAHAVETAGFEQVVPAGGGELSALAAALFRELEERQAGFETAARHLLAAMMVRVRRGLAHAQAAKVARGAPSAENEAVRRLQPALTHMATAYAKPLTIGDLAGACCMSERTFRRAFQTALGCAPLEYLLRLRVNTAAVLLRETALPVADIARSVGYPNASDFSRAFKKVLGTTPLRCRTAPRGPKPVHT